MKLSESPDKEDKIILKSVINASKGNLYAGEVQRELPFLMKRFYVIRDMPNSEIVRGGHTHKEIEQVIFCMNGSFELHLDDGNKKREITVNDPSVGIRLRKMVWHHMTKFSPDCVILVVASDYNDEANCIRDYDEFLRCAKTA